MAEQSLKVVIERSNAGQNVDALRRHEVIRRQPGARHAVERLAERVQPIPLDGQAGCHLPYRLKYGAHSVSAA